MSGKVNNGILNNYTKSPKNLTQCGVTDFTQIGQFETGYSFLSVLQMPLFMVKLAELDDGYKNLVTSFKHMLEFEFKGLEGLPGIESDTYEISDDVTVSFEEYYEGSGKLITKFCEAYLTGITKIE